MEYQKSITDSIIYTAVCDECKKKKFNSDTIRGIYSAARLSFAVNGQFLILALDRHGKILSESFFMPEEFMSLPESCSFFIKFALDSKADRLIIAGSFDKNPYFKMFEFYAACAYLISKALRENDSLLEGFYLTNGLSFENIAPSTDGVIKRGRR